MLNVKLSDMQNKSVLSLALATVYRPTGPYTDFLKEFADFLSDLLVNVNKALIVGDFNIHVDNTNDALGLAFIDLINSLGVKQNVTGPTHRFNHMLNLIISHEIDLTFTFTFMHLADNFIQSDSGYNCFFSLYNFFLSYLDRYRTSKWWCYWPFPCIVRAAYWWF